MYKNIYKNYALTFIIVIVFAFIMVIIGKILRVENYVNNPSKMKNIMSYLLGHVEVLNLTLKNY